MVRKNDARGYIYTLPALLLVVLFYYYPFLKSFLSSFFVSGTFVFLDNYITLFQNQYFIQSVKTTFLIASIFVPVNTFITLLAASLVRRKSRFNEIMGSLYIIPLAFSMALYALVFKQMFNPVNSVINRMFSLDIPWLNDRSSAIAVIVILCVFLDFALDYILLLSAFRKIEKNIIEASFIDGANELQRFFHIELPQIIPMLLMVIFISIRDALLISAPIMLLTEGGPFRSTETVMFYYYTEAFRGSNRVAESTISSITVIFSALLLLFCSLLQKRRHHA